MSAPAIRWTPRAHRLANAAGWAALAALGALLGFVVAVWLA
ncbi:hypothetical protein [Litorihabitans aurantiacus]|nr:hypothetical protein [Litorihabitans aurantiacus]